MSPKRLELGYLYISVVFLAVNLFFDWPIIQLAGIHAHGYPDMASILEAGSCSRFEFYPWVGAAGPCEGYIYGNTFLHFVHVLGLTKASTSAVVLLLTCVAITILAAIVNGLALRLIHRYLLFAAILLSPAVNLLFERGNLDLLIFILVIFMALALSRNRLALGTGLLALATLFKFYTLPIIALPVMSSRKKIARYFSLAVAMIILFDVIIELNRIANFPGFDTAQFGVTVWAYYPMALGFEIGDPTIWKVVGFAIFLGSLQIVKILGFGRLVKVESFNNVHLSQTSERMLVFLTTSATFVTCFLAGVNYDYRLVFFAAALLTVDAYIDLSKPLSKWLIAGGILSLMFTTQPYAVVFKTFGWPWTLFAPGLQLIGDILLTCFAALFTTILCVQILRLIPKVQAQKLADFAIRKFF